jgi:hemoglobin
VGAAQRETLFARIGGEPAIERLLEAFYERVLADPALAPFFAGIAMPKLRSMQKLFFCAALDGPVEYSGRPLATVHYGMGIRPPHLARFVEHLLTTLRDQQLDEDDVLEIVSRIDTYADEITGDTTVDA